ncbi:MAG: hypothetical protein PHQ23_13795 [Candidatus Wallbacteria bacterium]|nr:hypothetical protein [Candidatus Wallbacteria bacterium]
MQDPLVVTYKYNYVHVQNFGQMNLDPSSNRWHDIKDECDKNNCYKILGETFGTDKLKPADSYQLMEVLRGAGITADFKIAWVFHFVESYDKMLPAQEFLNQSGQVNARLFKTVEEALEWLLKDSDK